MSAYNTESALASLIPPRYSRGQDESPLIREAATLPGDLQIIGTLEVTTPTATRSASTWAIGPVLRLGDAVGNKLSADYSRAFPRDFLDVDSIRASGKFTDADVIRAAIERDPGFEVPMFVSQLQRVHRVLHEQVSQYNVEADQLNGIKNRFDVWASTLRAEL